VKENNHNPFISVGGVAHTRFPYVHTDRRMDVNKSICAHTLCCYTHLQIQSQYWWTVQLLSYGTYRYKVNVDELYSSYTHLQIQSQCWWTVHLLHPLTDTKSML